MPQQNVGSVNKKFVVAKKCSFIEEKFLKTVLEWNNFSGTKQKLC